MLAWATFTTDLTLTGDRTIPVYTVSHRRVESIHCFLATCGTTLAGQATRAYFEDEEERCQSEMAEYEICRKAQRVLNDCTLAQPTIDRHNRYRQVCSQAPPVPLHTADSLDRAHAHLCLLCCVQAILAMEKRFVTNNFSFRFFTTMLGTVVTNAFSAHRYFNDPQVRTALCCRSACRPCSA